MRKYNLTFVLIILSVLQSCAMFDKKNTDPYKSMTEVELYNEASVFLGNADIPQARALFELLEVNPASANCCDGEKYNGKLVEN